MDEFNPKEYSLPVLEQNLAELKRYCEISKIDFQALVGISKNREMSDDWALEEKIHKTELPMLMHEYYATSKIYLYELTLGESRHNYLNIFNLFCRYASSKKAKRVLDFGSGIGGLSIALNSVGIRCDCADVPGETSKYAGYRLKVRGISVSQFTEESYSSLKETFDVVFSMDCLEHLAPLSKYVSHFYNILRPGGTFVCIASFYGVGLHIASNHKYNELKVFNSLMADAGFEFKGQLINRVGVDVRLPPALLELLGVKTTSGRKLIYQKV